MTTAIERLPRDSALALIRKAKAIFIAYSHSDLKTARLIRKKILRFRHDPSGTPVFLDQDSIPPAQPVSPEVVEDILRSSDLVVVVCGNDTARSVTVQREISLALQGMKEGRSHVLPVIIRARTVLPSALDYRLQGVFLTVLFPEIQYVRFAVASALILLVGLAAALGVAQERGAIDLVLERDLSLRVPSHLGRQENLEGLLGRARLVAYRVGDIEGLLAKVPSSTARIELLAPDATTRQIATSSDGRYLYIGHPQRVEVRDLSSPVAPLVSCLDLTNLIVSSPTTESELTLPDANTIADETNQRTPATLTRIVSDPYDAGVLMEVAYDGFAKADAGDGDPVRGSEREVFRLSGGSSVTSLGLSSPLTRKIGHDLNGEEYGGSWWEIDQGANNNWWAKFQHLPERPSIAVPIGTEIAEEDHDDSKIVHQVLATDPLGPAFLIRVERFLDSRGRVWTLGAAAREIFPAVVWPGGLGTVVGRKVSFHPDASYLVDPDVGNQPAAGWTSKEPSYSPAALHFSKHLALLRDHVVEFPPDGQPRDLGQIDDVDWSTVDTARFTLEGQSLLLTLRDGAIASVGLQSLRIEHKLTPPLRSRQLAVSPVGDRVFSLRDDGAVESWTLQDLGPDGWRVPD